VRRDIIAGMALAVAIATKVYAVALVGPILLFRKYRLSIVAVLLVVVGIAVQRDLWMKAIGHFSGRSADFIYYENSSIFAPPSYVGWRIGRHLAEAYGQSSHTAAVLAFAGILVGLVFILTLALGAVLADIKYFLSGEGRYSDEEVGLSLLLYLPFLTTFPISVFGYAQIHLLLLVPAAHAIQRRVKPGMLSTALFLIGFILTGVQWPAFQSFWNTPWPMELPGVGLALLIIWSVRMKWTLLRSAIADESLGQQGLRPLPASARAM